jgi:hypothetical protein
MEKIKNFKNFFYTGRVFILQPVDFTYKPGSQGENCWTQKQYCGTGTAGSATFCLSGTGPNKKPLGYNSQK